MPPNVLLPALTTTVRRTETNASMVYRVGIERSQEAHPEVEVEIAVENDHLSVRRIPVGPLSGQNGATTEAMRET